MYQSIYVPVDNSRHSNRAIDTALQLGQGFQSRMTGSHVYAAKMHDYRFKQMEFTLPEEYLVEQELHRQRKIHDSLITMGLQLISDCYLEPMGARCEEVGLPFEPKMMDGKHSTELIRDIEDSDYDLVVMGVLGVGKTRDSQIGAVCSRVTQECARDTWVVKHLPKKDEPERDTILVGVDGSPRSFGALTTALELARKFDKKVEVIGVYDPYLHYAVFKGIVDVLTERAAKVFRFEEQNQLHEEIIDTGLAQIYQSHLEVAESMAREAGIEVTKTLLDGKAFQKVLDHVRKVEPWVLVVGRDGVHAGDDETGLGSNTENLLRLCACDILLTNSEVVPELDLRAEESIHWTPEALERMDRVPPQVLGIARTAILRLAIEQGHSVVSSDLVTEAMERFMPKKAADANVRLAEALVLHRAEEEPVAVCASCGVAARTQDPVTCTVCGSVEFERISAETIARIIAEEGGVEEEMTYDGRKIRWTQEAKASLKFLEDRYQRRRAKARIEKAARIQKLDPISLEFAQRFVEEEAGVLYQPSAEYQERKAEVARNGVPERVEPALPRPADEDAEDDAEREGKIWGRDANDVPLVSSYEWRAEAVERVLRVPAGFMRDNTQERIEGLAAKDPRQAIDLALVEEGLALGRQLMEEMLSQYQPPAPASTEPVVEAAPTPEPTKASGGCPFHVALESGAADTVREVMKEYPLNEVSVMTEMERQKRDLPKEN